MQFVGLLLIVNSLVAGAWWMASGRSQFAVVPLCLAALLAGVFLFRQDSARKSVGAASGDDAIELPSPAAMQEIVRQTREAKTLLADLQDQTAVADWHLKQLDERVSAIRVLPDGRTRMGAVVTGQAVVLMPKLEELQKLAAERPGEALPLARECVEIFEATRAQIVGLTLVSGDLGAETIAWLYAAAAASAQRAGDHEATLQWARAAVKMHASTERQFLLVTALINKNLTSEANALIQRELKIGGESARKFRQLLEQYKIAIPR